MALWVWHIPAAFDAAAANYPLHLLEHACFFGTALLFWRAILAAGSSHRTVSALAAAFATLFHGGLLGALITLAPGALYAHYAEPARRWGLSAIEDQQLAGLLMWVPMGIVYLGACLMLAVRLVVPMEARAKSAAALEVGHFHGHLKRRIPGREVSDLLVAEALGDDRHLRMVALARPVGVEFLGQVDRALAGKIRNVGHPAYAVLAVAGSALPDDLPAGRGIAGDRRRRGF